MSTTREQTFRTRIATAAIVLMYLLLGGCANDVCLGDAPPAGDADLHEGAPDGDMESDADEGSDGDTDADAEPEAAEAEAEEEVVWIDADIYGVANGCFAIALHDDSSYLTISTDGSSFAFEPIEAVAAPAFRLRPTDLGQYLLYDMERNYLAAEASDETESVVRWTPFRTADKQRIRIHYHETYSNAEWELESAGLADDAYLFRHINSGLYLSASGLADKEHASALRFLPRARCVEYPELTLDAQGDVRKTPWENGDVYGIADIHEHLFTDVAFGGGGVFHGSPFHRLGVEHALGDCEENHGPEAKRDLMGYVFHGNRTPEVSEFLEIVNNGSVSEHVHNTDGYPTFSDWPNPRKVATHQAMYYRWIERAWMGGLRLIVNLSTGNSALCKILVGVGSQDAPYGCNDMDSVDRNIAQARAMERYIDALWGGPGNGWFRIVESPAEAREIINQGKLAVVLGIEITNIFDCFLSPPEGMPECDADLVREQVREYYEAGVRVVFPVHKFDNGFSPGDGQRGALEIGNIVNTGHYNNYIEDCPDIPTFGDKGGVLFGGLNRPRDEYDAPPVLDLADIETDLVSALFPLMIDMGDPLEGNYCNKATLTPMGELLINELMARGMIIDVAHLPRRSLLRTFEILDEHDYPAISTHGNTHDGRIYDYGGLSNSGFGRCASLDQPDTMANGFRNRAAQLQQANGLLAPPLGFDFNGMAGAPGPRFGDDSGCAQPQPNPITYPFTSFDGQVTFTEPRLGVRSVDFNTEGMVHFGLLPEYIEDVRRDGMSDEDLEPLFHTAEVFLKVWEQTEARRIAPDDADRLRFY